MVFTFIPPPIDCDEHPTHMRNIMIRNIVCDSDDSGSDENPAVRGVANSLVYENIPRPHP